VRVRIPLAGGRLAGGQHAAALEHLNPRQLAHGFGAGAGVAVNDRRGLDDERVGVTLTLG